MKKVLGIGNALVDIMTRLEDDRFLEIIGLPKGSMQLVDEAFVEKITPQIAPLKKSISAGGSAANTINGLANLGVACGFIGVVGADEMGVFFADDMKDSGITPHLYTSQNKSGIAVAFVSPDSERTFATYLGAALELTDAHLDENVFKQYDIIHIEGYLVQNYVLIEGIMKTAKNCGLIISLDLASYNVVDTHLDFIKKLVEDYVDIVFANEEEAKSFTGKEPNEALNILSQSCRTVIVKTGKNGSLLKNAKDTKVVGAIDANCIDTTGAGDLYAAGFFYGLINEFPLEICGKIGAVVAGNVIEVVGSKMEAERWLKLRNIINDIISV